MFDRLLWHSPTLTPAVAVCAAVVAALVLWVYRRQARAIPPPWRVLMPLLRVAAVAALAISVLRPGVVRPRTVPEYGAVVVLIDGSASMNVIDTGRAPAELVEVADALGRLPANARQRLTVDVQAAHDTLGALVRDLTLARSEFDYAQLTGQPTDAARARLQQSQRAAEALAERLA